MFKNSYVKVIIGFLIVFSINQASSQELKIHLGTQIYGMIDGGFNGGGIGFESPLTQKSTFDFDFTIGTQSRGTAYSFKPSYLFYLSENQKGFFIGPSLKYISLKEKEGRNSFDDSLYALGFSLGFKFDFLNDFDLLFKLNPHLTVGGQGEGNVAGISGQFGLSYRI